MAVDVEEQLRKDIDACECFSLDFVESTDMVDVAHMCEDMSTWYELLTILPLQGSGVSKVWQAWHVPWAQLAGGAQNLLGTNKNFYLQFLEPLFCTPSNHKLRTHI